VDQVELDLEFDSLWEAKHAAVALLKFQKKVRKEVEEELY